MASQEAVFPFSSVPVSVTVFSPIFSQVNESTSILKVIAVQLSAEPPSISSGVIVALPSSSKATVILSQTIIGATSSIIVIVNEQVEMFPF